MHHQVEQAHLQRLIHLFDTAPIQQTYSGLQMQLEAGKCRILYPVSPAFFHGALAMHGSVYFKLLDDAAYFAAATLAPDYFLLTTRFEIRLLRPVVDGELTATGTLDAENDRGFSASAEIRDNNNKLIATGTGQFVKSQIEWKNLSGYTL